MHLSEDYVIGSTATIAVFGAVTSNEFATWGAALATVSVALYSAYRSQRNQVLQDRRVSKSLDTIYEMNEKAIRQGELPPFPEYLPELRHPLRFTGWSGSEDGNRSTGRS
jgi:hypothetical protein